MPRIFRDSLRTFSSSEDQPPSRADPAQGTTFSASGAGNGESGASPATALRTSPATWPSVRSPATAASSSYSRSAPDWPAPDAAWYDATTNSRSAHRACRVPSAAIIVSVVQFGFAMMPLGRSRAAAGFTSGTTSGTSGSIRNAAELSTTTAPAAAATGA